MVERLFKDPVAFAQSFENANPAAVQSVIDMVNDLIAEGEGKKADIIQTHEDAVATTAAAVGELDVALDVLETATGERIEADDEVTRLKSVLQQKQNAESAASVAKSSATASLGDAQEWMDTEVARVDEEKAALEEVQEILADLPTGFRRLLSSSSSLIPMGMLSKTDPGAVAEVVALVDDLIAAGEGVRTQVTGDRDVAQDDLNSKTVHWQSAVSHTVSAQDSLAAGETFAGGKLVVENSALAVHVEKTTIKDTAVADEAEKKAIRDEQVPILDHEDAELANVVSILEGLLPSE